MAKPNAANATGKSRFDQEEDISSFPPYWKAAVGESVEVIVEGLDASDPEFPRFVLRSVQDEPISCVRGPKDSQSEVAVQKGDAFTCSVYGGLIGTKPTKKNPKEVFSGGILDYAGLEIRISCTEERDTGKPNPMFVFKIGTTPDTRKQLQDRKAALATNANGVQAPF